MIFDYNEHLIFIVIRLRNNHKRKHTKKLFNNSDGFFLDAKKEFDIDRPEILERVLGFS